MLPISLLKLKIYFAILWKGDTADCVNWVHSFHYIMCSSHFVIRFLIRSCALMIIWWSCFLVVYTPHLTIHSVYLLLRLSSWKHHQSILLYVLIIKSYNLFLLCTPVIPGRSLLTMHSHHAFFERTLSMYSSYELLT